MDGVSQTQHRPWPGAMKYMKRERKLIAGQQAGYRQSNEAFPSRRDGETSDFEIL